MGGGLHAQMPVPKKSSPLTRRLAELDNCWMRLEGDIQHGETHCIGPEILEPAARTRHEEWRFLPGRLPIHVGSKVRLGRVPQLGAAMRAARAQPCGSSLDERKKIQRPTDCLTGGEVLVCSG